MLHELELKALEFATAAHRGQQRKYTGEPYIDHPIAVAEIVRNVAHSSVMVAAAYLHDVIEDCGIESQWLLSMFPSEVVDLVVWLTDVSIPSDGNRGVRKEIDREHIAHAPAEAMTIKLADIIDNTATIKERDPKFWEVYRLEKLALLKVLKGGDPTLWERAMEQCR